MGLLIYNYHLNKHITCDKVYVNTRNIEMNKENDAFTLSAHYYIYYKDKLVDIKYIKTMQSLTYTGNIWSLLYGLFKQNLTALNYKFVDH